MHRVRQLEEKYERKMLKVFIHEIFSLKELFSEKKVYQYKSCVFIVNFTTTKYMCKAFLNANK